MSVNGRIAVDLASCRGPFLAWALGQGGGQLELNWLDIGFITNIKKLFSSSVFNSIGN